MSIIIMNLRRYEGRGKEMAMIIMGLISADKASSPSKDQGSLFGI